MSTQETVRIELGARSYDVLVGTGLLKQAGALISKVTSASKVFVIADKNAHKLYGQELNSAIKAEEIIIEPGEQSKTFASYEKVMESILAKSPDRKSLIIALGGGVAGDLGGFVAATLLRGVDFVQIPTTLLAQVDSSVGGKNGINSKYGKNLTGTFYQPKLVIADIDTLKSLPARTLKAGYAEVVKYGFINDAPFFSWLEVNAEKALSGDTSLLTHMVAKCVQAKAKIVEADEKEAGQRMLLNLGHTFGHGLEAIAEFDENKLMHGEAVAIGMAMAFAYSAELGLCAKGDYEKAKAHLIKVGLPVHSKERGMGPSAEELINAMQGDKKAEGGKLKLILAKGIGASFVYKEESPEKLQKFIAQYLA